MEKYKPNILEDGKYAEMLIEIKKCKICGAFMVKDLGHHSIFPKYFKINQEAQMKESGLEYSSNVMVDEELICKKCEKEGKATFECVLCGERKHTDKIQESIGYPAEFLCKDCYETKPAKTWDEELSRLYEIHKYDNE